MRKHFLFLLLMTLLPLAGWATERITVTLGTINKVYGEADPGVTALDFSWTTDGGGTATEVNAANLLAALDYRRVSAGDEVNSVKYYTMVANNHKPDDWIIVIANQGVINIMPKSLGTGTTALPTNITIADIDGISYTGEAKTPALLVHYTGTLVDEDLVKDRDYEVVWDNNTDAGTATATLTGIGNYEGSVVKEFTIAARSLANVTIADIPDQTFAWDNNNVAIAQTPGITVTDAELGTTLVAGTDYVMLTDAEYTDGYKDNYNAGTGLVRIVGNGNYDNTTTADASFIINPMSIVDADGNLINGFGLGSTTAAEGLVYTGEALTPSIPFRCHGTNSNVNANSVTEYANNINATTAESKATLTWTGINNLTGSYTFKFDIAQRPAADLTFDASLEADETYKGSKITKITEDMVTYGTLPALVAGTDFDVVNGDNLNVGTDAGSTEFTFKGNYTGTVTKYFKITRPTLTVAAKNFTKSLGNADPTSDQLATGNYYEITGFVGGENATTAGVTGTPGFTIEAHTETAGTKAGVISISDITGLNAANYFFAASATNADLIISSAGVAIAATDATQTYGYKLPTLDKDAFGFTETGLLSGENITALTFTVKDVNNVEYAAGDMLEVGEYTITPSAASATSNSYEFSYTPATLTINPKVIKFVAADQEIDYGSEPTLAGWANTVVKMVDEDGTLIGKTAFQGLYGVWKEDFVESLTWEVAANKPVAEPGTIKVNLKAVYDNKNFTVTTADGTVTYKAGTAPTALALTSTDADLAKIQQFDGQKMNVTIDFTPRARTLNGKAREWKANTWVTMTLPFDISVAKLSEALGYAIVNVIDPSRTKLGDNGYEVYGKLTMKGGNGYIEGTDETTKDTKLAANKPFMVKTADATTGVINFGSQKIIAPANAEALTVDAGKGIKFVGTYESMEVSSANDAKIWFLLGNNDNWAYIGSSVDPSITWNIVPFEGYLDMANADPSAARNMTFYFEELNGSTTAIRSVNVDDLNGKIATEGMYNLNGMKLNTVPTQKGVYILNGKKVVIK